MSSDRTPRARSSIRIRPPDPVVPRANPPSKTSAPSTGCPSGSSTATSRSATPPSDGRRETSTTCTLVWSSSIRRLRACPPNVGEVISRDQPPGPKTWTRSPSGSTGTAGSRLGPRNRTIASDAAAPSGPRTITRTVPGTGTSTTGSTEAPVATVRSTVAKPTFSTTSVWSPSISPASDTTPPLEVAPTGSPSSTTRAPPIPAPEASTTSNATSPAPASGASTASTFGMLPEGSTTTERTCSPRPGAVSRTLRVPGGSAMVAPAPVRPSRTAPSADVACHVPTTGAPSRSVTRSSTLRGSGARATTTGPVFAVPGAGTSIGGRSPTTICTDRGHNSAPSTSAWPAPPVRATSTPSARTRASATGRPAGSRTSSTTRPAAATTGAASSSRPSSPIDAPTKARKGALPGPRPMAAPAAAPLHSPAPSPPRSPRTESSASPLRCTPPGDDLPSKTGAEPGSS